MNRRLSALLVPLALAGCAVVPRGSDEGLRAGVAHRLDGVHVSLSEPAYVAIFHVAPGEQVRMFYPAAESDPARLDAGRTTVISGNRRLNAIQVAARVEDAPLVYLVASRQPLDEARLSDIRTGQVSLASGLDREETMELLASLVVPAETPETDWAADVAAMYRRAGRFAAGGSRIPVMPPSPGATDCFGHREPQVVCTHPAQGRGDGSGGHRVDDNINPPPEN